MSETCASSSKIDNNTENVIESNCRDMCPSNEYERRRKEKQVHLLEMTLHGYKLVKSNCWSIVNSKMADPQSIRYFVPLSDTVHYLFLELSERLDVKKHEMYDFFDDRLMAVREDMKIQGLSPEHCVVLLEPIIRFYIYFSYRLFDYHISIFDPLVNRHHTLECVKWFVKCCDVLDRTKSLEDEMKTVRGPIKSALDIYKLGPDLSCDRALIESIYILLNLNYIEPLYRYLSLPGYVKRSPALKLAYNIGIANMNNNFSRVVNLSKKLCPLTYAVFSYHLPTIQKRALHALSYACNSDHRDVPVEYLKSWLGYSSYQEVRNDSVRYGLSVVMPKHGILFERTKFKADVEPPLRISYNAKILGKELVDVLTYYPTGERFDTKCTAIKNNKEPRPSWIRLKGVPYPK